MRYLWIHLATGPVAEKKWLDGMQKVFRLSGGEAENQKMNPNISDRTLLDEMRTDVAVIKNSLENIEKSVRAVPEHTTQLALLKQDLHGFKKLFYGTGVIGALSASLYSWMFDK